MPEEIQDPKFFCVAIGLTDRAYGGPEEGGWYYDTFEPVPEYAYLTKIIKSESELEAARKELDQFIEEHGLNKGRRPVSSVLSDGIFATCIFIDEYPTCKPDRKPHYE